ncbi:hypothetical protein [Conexibacter woesei]|uniref:Abortive infection protein n=1 Tax=Conexibacter woesei (strain DSM 14684 / CCUG 47730 / CIP 108061 / JCM 11494 / NBRC 100937 / ID131577) TaxID=469383 RepID=D3F9R0_CONWI|nr:hypothetical protein [Conexibacter woesei]ADB51122.1 conserved hypothetical protein [Conexibacter woesei DSM 14684]
MRPTDDALETGLMDEIERLRGISYDTGTSYGRRQPLSRVRWERAEMEAEVAAVREQLHCNTLLVFGSDVERLTATARAALEGGLHAIVQPRLFDCRPARILRHLAEAADAGERLRREHPGRVTLLAGCEAPIFTPGIVRGRSFQRRIARLRAGGVDRAALGRRLNDYLARASSVARARFDGPVGYAAVPFEPVDWGLFDLVGLDHYAFHETPEGHARALAPFRAFGKPIVICEFGCCAFRGAARMGGMAWTIVDWGRSRAQIPDGVVRSESEQADAVAAMLAAFESEPLRGACVFTFAEFSMPHSPVTRDDLDVASYGVAKVIREDPDDPASPYRWEPKLAFHAIAEHNESAQIRA